ncbi:hypothetical protein CCYA_CCYA01G0319 [Cyanidiococcus yangmingshanensis]|nr:hypothetical protein CCYA_CCYA01G0319 [Cyanidiococcus yangmingshanensis]
MRLWPQKLLIRRTIRVSGSRSLCHQTVRGRSANVDQVTGEKCFVPPSALQGLCPVNRQQRDRQTLNQTWRSLEHTRSSKCSVLFDFIHGLKRFELVQCLAERTPSSFLLLRRAARSEQTEVTPELVLRSPVRSNVATASSYLEMPCCERDASQTAFARQSLPFGGQAQTRGARPRENLSRQSLLVTLEVSLFWSHGRRHACNARALWTSAGLSLQQQGKHPDSVANRIRSRLCSPCSTYTQQRLVRPEQERHPMFIERWFRSPCCSRQGLWRTLTTTSHRGSEEKAILRVNGEIPSTMQCLLVSADGQKLGVFFVAEALEQAASKGLDLVEVAPKARPFPVCRMVASARTVLSTRARKTTQHAARAMRQSRQQATKEIRLSPVTQEHDFALKIRRAREFLAEGTRVRVYIMFRRGHGRKRHEAITLLTRARDALADVGRLQPGSVFEQHTTFDEPDATDQTASQKNGQVSATVVSRRTLDFLMHPVPSQHNSAHD